MKARRKSDGEIIEVREWRGASDVIYPSPDMNQFYQASDLDFNLDADTVIQGWVAVDDDGDLFLYRTKPARDEVSGMWMSGECPLDVGINLFPNLTWDDEPQEVEIQIKRKKNG